MKGNNVTAKQLAETLKVSQAAITKAISTGRLKESIIRKEKDGYLIDLEKAQYEWENNRQRRPAAQVLAKIQGLEDQSGEFPTQQESIQRKENAQAEIASIKLKGLMKNRIEFKEVEKAIFENIQTTDEPLARKVVNEFRECLIKKYR